MVHVAPINKFALGETKKCASAKNMESLNHCVLAEDSLPDVYVPVLPYVLWKRLLLRDECSSSPLFQEVSGVAD